MRPITNVFLHTPTTTGRSLFPDLAIFTLAVFLAVLSGFRFCAGDLDTYLPFLLHSHDPSLFKNDLLLGTLNSHPVYIWKILSVFLRWIPIGSLMRYAFVLQTMIIALGAIFFFRRFFGPTRRGLFFLLLLIIPVSAPGYGMYGLNPYGYFHAGALAFGLTLLAYCAIDRRWPIVGGILTGTIFLLHPITAVYAAGFFFVRGIMDFKKGDLRLQTLTGGILLILVALPSLVPAIKTFLVQAQGYPVDTELWRSIARLRMNHGYFISAWVPERFIQLAVCFGLILIPFRKHPAFIRLLPMVIVIAGGLLLMAVADLLTVRFFIRLQLGRCTYFLFFLVTAFAADTLTNSEFWKRDRTTLASWTVAALTVLIIYGNAALSNQHGALRAIVVFFLVTGITLIALRWYRRLHPGLLFILLSTMIVTAVVARSIDRLRWTHAQEFSDPWISFGSGCAAVIPKNSIVMIPITQQCFRPYALRATWGTWKDGAPHLFCDKTLHEWWRRMQLFGITLKTNKKELPALYHDQAIEVARAEGVRYVVFEKERAVSTGPLVYENPAFGLIDLDAWTSADSLKIP
jgi:hypothetical protein